MITLQHSQFGKYFACVSSIRVKTATKNFNIEHIHMKRQFLFYYQVKIYSILANEGHINSGHQVHLILMNEDIMPSAATFVPETNVFIPVTLEIFIHCFLTLISSFLAFNANLEVIICYLFSILGFSYPFPILPMTKVHWHLVH